ncbi:Uncharacterised protein [Mycobacteroides abscessus subsp. abscessus]|uniref:hypothetical protein n=1 Tax=Mycobacteroides abscessus TaxID=36809 RepID=UPI0009A6CAE3|nr:hypothetical protein [Mycobacteroides abscessus]SLJ22848.1 Uncharacterised protein [Mycobacteroides abscessus subsp. abscessus]
MARLRKPTATNITASIDIRRQILERISELSTTAEQAFTAVQTAETDAQLELLASARTAQLEIDAAVVELASAVLLAGVPAHTVSTQSGISTATLTRNNPPYMAGLRGHDLVQDPSAPYGWRVAAT